MYLLLCELKKTITIKNLILIVTAVIIQIVITMLPHSSNQPYSIDVYKKYVLELNGKYTDEKKDMIFNRQREIDDIIASYDDISSNYKRDQITLDEFEKYNIEYKKALAEKETVDYLVEKCLYFDEIESDTYFFYDTEWLNYFSRSHYNYIVAILLFLLIIPIFDNEYSSNSKSVIATTVNGYITVCLYKLVAVTIVSVTVSIIIYSTDYITFLLSTKSSDSFEIQSIIGYSGFMGTTIRQYCVNDILVKTVSWIICALLICVISNLIRETAFTFFFCFVILIFPSFMADHITWINSHYVILSLQINMMYTADTSISILTMIYLIKAIIYSFSCVWLWTNNETLSERF